LFSLVLLHNEANLIILRKTVIYRNINDINKF